MKRITSLILLLLLLLCTSCNKGKTQLTDIEPKTSQMKAICELAVMDCYYHNVAKYFEEDASRFLIWTKDKNFWVEYSGIVRLGIDVSKVTVEVSGTTVTITLPEATVLSCKVDSKSLNEDSFIVAEDSADTEARDTVKAIEEAQAKMEASASADKVLLAAAQQRAQILLEEYVQNIGETTGKSYSIKWIFVDSDGKKTGEEYEAKDVSAPNET